MPPPLRRRRPPLLLPLLLGGAVGRGRPEAAEAWGEEDVAAWLEERGLGEQVPAFRRERIDGPALLELTPEELRDDLGLAALGVRKRLLREVGPLRHSADAGAAGGSGGGSCPSPGDCSGCCDQPEQNATVPVQHGWGFDFGGNWLRFLDGMLEMETPMGLAEAKNMLADKGIEVRRIHGRVLRFVSALNDDYGLEAFTGLSFLDVGAGHALASLAALVLNASHVVTLDVDTRPAKALKRMITENKQLGFALQPWQNWTIITGSILDTDFVTSGKVPQSDLVWSYGVLHHTGNLSLALHNIAQLVRPTGLMRIEVHTSEEVAFLSDWMDFKRDWVTRPDWFKEEALVAYMFSELWAEMQDGIRMELLEEHFPGQAMAPGFFGRFESIRHVVHARFWQYTKGRGMDFVIDAVDWLGGYPYEMWRTQAVIAELRAAGLMALHATFSGFLGLLLTPAAPEIGWAEASERMLGNFDALVSHEKGDLWEVKRKLLPVVPQAIDNLSSLVANNCADFEFREEEETPQRAICSPDFLLQVRGHACWVVFFGAQGIKGDDMTLFHLFEDGAINGWGSANMSLCIPGAGATYRFFSSGIALFTVRDGSNPKTNGRKYHILAPV